MKKKLIPFSIEQAEAGAKVVTRNGLPVRIVDTNVANENPILGLIKIEGVERPYLWMQSGEFSKLSGSEGLDLFIEEEGIENQDGQKLSDKFEIMPDKWYVCTCPYTGEDFLFLLNFPYLGKDILKCHLPEDKNYQDFLRPWTDQDANSNEWASLVSYMDKNKADRDKIKPKFKVGDVMRLWDEAEDGITGGLPVVISISDDYYHCTNEEIPIIYQNKYEYPPMNEKHTHTVKCRRMTYRELWWWITDYDLYEKREYCYKSNLSYPFSYHEYSYKEEDADKEVKDILIRTDEGEWMEPLIEI